jgi:hypothetical protein
MPRREETDQAAEIERRHALEAAAAEEELAERRFAGWKKRHGLLEEKSEKDTQPS